MKKAFTLIELLVVIAIIAILASILFPVFAQAKAAAKATACLSNTKGMGLGVQLYLGDNDDRMFFRSSTNAASTRAGIAIPSTDPNASAMKWWNQLYPYVKSRDMYHCPSDRTPGARPTPSGRSTRPARRRSPSPTSRTPPPRTSRPRTWTASRR